MYDYSEDEESSLPLPSKWIRTIDVTGRLIYKNFINGNTLLIKRKGIFPTI